jgi:putative transposase
MHVVNHHSVSYLKQRAKKEKNARLRIRLQTIILAMQGYTAPQIVEVLGVSRRPIQEYVYRYNRDGLEGLKDRRCGGNHRHLTDEEERQISVYLNRTAGDPRQGVRRGEDLRRWIERQFGILYSINGIYELLHRLGYSCLMPRPRHANADPEIQAAFKKTPWRKSNKSPKNTRKNTSKFGSRTKPASGNKGR